MSFFCLEKIGQNGKLNDLYDLYTKEKTKCFKTLDSIARVSKLLANSNIDHAVYKTLRPYESTTVDIDILVFGDRGSFKKAVRTMLEAGYELVVRGPRSTTLRDTELDMGIDLYEQIAVSYVTYMDKRRLVDYLTITKLPNGSQVKTLKAEADLACIIAHSVIKEHMYTLSEYYTFIYYVKQLDVERFLRIATRNNLTSAVRTHASITAMLHMAAHRTTPNKLQQILDRFGQDYLETARLIENDLHTPHKYHPITIVESIVEILKAKETRNSISEQLVHMLDPKISRDFLKRLIDHIFRETY